MSEWVTLDVLDGIGPVAIKRRRPADDPSLVEHEQDILRQIDRPGVVRVVTEHDRPGSELVTHFVGTHSLATTPGISTEGATALIVSLVEIVEQLHRDGFRHGAIEPSHVLIGPGGRPVLCGFSRAAGPDRPGDPPTASDDIAGVGRVMASVLADHDELEPIPGHRSLRRAGWQGYRQRALLSLADHCQADDPAARPSATSLSATLADLVGAESVPTRRQGATDLHESIRSIARRSLARLPAHTPSRALVAAVLVVAGVVAVGGAVRSFGRTTPATAESTPVTAEADPLALWSPPTTTIPDSTSTTDPAVPTTIPAAAPACTDDAVGPDVTGDGCTDGDAEVDGHVVTVDGERFELGVPGDAVLLGDWNCTGLQTAVLVRRDPAALWHFPTWADPDETVEAQFLVAEIEPASAELARTEDGCDAIQVVIAGHREPQRIEVDA